MFSLESRSSPYLYRRFSWSGWTFRQTSAANAHQLSHSTPAGRSLASFAISRSLSWRINWVYENKSPHALAWRVDSSFLGISLEQIFFLKKSWSRRKVGKGFMNIRNSCQTRCRSVCSVIIISRCIIFCRWRGRIFLGRPAHHRYLWISFSLKTDSSRTRNSDCVSSGLKWGNLKTEVTKVGSALRLAPVLFGVGFSLTVGLASWSPLACF